MSGFTESIVEDAALAWVEALGYTVLHGPDIAVGESGAKRSDPNYPDVLLERPWRQALAHLNPDLPSEAVEETVRAAQPVEVNRVAEPPGRYEAGEGTGGEPGELQVSDAAQYLEASAP
jgi:hypothetical protein